MPTNSHSGVLLGSWDSVGMRATESLGLKWENSPISDENLLGGDGAFEYIALATMGPIAFCGFAAVWLGIAQGAMDRLLDHIAGREHLYPIASRDPEVSDDNPCVRMLHRGLRQYESVQRQVAEAQVLIEQTRSLVYSSARAIDLSKPDRHSPMPIHVLPSVHRLVLAARIAAAEAAVTVCTTAMRLAGASGYRRHGPGIERYWRDSISGQIMGPSLDLSKILLGKLMLGLPVVTSGAFVK